MNEGQYLKNCFAIADNFMDINQYDSSQIWLNRIADVLPLKKPSLSTYFLSTRQAEVYYYNGLQRLGLQESERSLVIAETLQDSLLLADACNFIGLFLMNLDSNREAVPYFKKGILYTRQPPYPDGYLSLTKPHHLYGNMAEAYQKMNIPDSAIYFSNASLRLALQIGWMRGIAVAHSTLGNIFLKMHNSDSALHHYMLSGAATIQGGDLDVQLLNYGRMAIAEQLAGKNDKAQQWLQLGFELLENNPAVNNFFSNQFLDDAITLYKAYKQNDKLDLALEKKSELLQKQIDNNNRQMNVILNAGLRNETRLLNLEVERAKQQNEISTTRFYLLLLFLLLVIGAFLLYRYRIRQQLKFTQLQNKISQDLHDDVGSSLSSMQVYSAVAEKEIDRSPAKTIEMLKKISAQSASLMENINDIVWSMKTETAQVMLLGTKVRNFVSDVLSAANINYVINIEEEAETLVKNITAKKNILLFIKEAINNTVKYSNASFVSVAIKKIGDHICVQVADNGKGFAETFAQIKGEGFINMKIRIEELNGIFEITSVPGKGTTVAALLPIPIISDTF